VGVSGVGLEYGLISSGEDGDDVVRGIFIVSKGANANVRCHCI